MRTSTLVAALFVLSFVSFAAFAQEQPAAPEPEQGVGGSSFHKNDITYSTEVPTPHVEWAGKLPGGPIKGFFIPSVEFGRDMVELMQRIPLEPTTVSIDRNWDTNCWGIGDYYGHPERGNIDDFRIEAIPSGHIIYFTNEDRPGIIGVPLHEDIKHYGTDLFLV